MFLLAGLGNPGDEYALTRHNLGKMLLENFCKFHSLLIKKERKFLADVSSSSTIGNSEEVQIMLPRTYMNDSGSAVASFMRFYKLKTENLIVVSDDVEIPFGTIRLRKGGSSGGHNGLKSIIYKLGDNKFPRLKLGIGRRKEEISSRDLSGYVLQRFSKHEIDLLPQVMDNGIAVLNCIFSQGFNSAMQLAGDLNKKFLNNVSEDPGN